MSADIKFYFTFSYPNLHFPNNFHQNRTKIAQVSYWGGFWVGWLGWSDYGPSQTICICKVFLSIRDFHTKFHKNWVRITEVSTCIYCTHSIGAILKSRISRCPTFCIMAQKIGLTLTNGCKNLIPQLLEWSPVKKNTLKFTGTLSKKINLGFSLT